MSEVFSIFADTIKDLAISSGIANMSWKDAVMILISFIFMYLAIVKQFEPAFAASDCFWYVFNQLAGSRHVSSVFMGKYVKY